MRNRCCSVVSGCGVLKYSYHHTNLCSQGRGFERRGATVYIGNEFAMAGGLRVNNGGLDRERASDDDIQFLVQTGRLLLDTDQDDLLWLVVQAIGRLNKRAGEC